MHNDFWHYLWFLIYTTLELWEKQYYVHNPAVPTTPRCFKFQNEFTSLAAARCSLRSLASFPNRRRISAKSCDLLGLTPIMMTTVAVLLNSIGRRLDLHDFPLQMRLAEMMAPSVADRWSAFCVSSFFMLTRMKQVDITRCVFISFDYLFRRPRHSPKQVFCVCHGVVELQTRSIVFRRYT